MQEIVAGKYLDTIGEKYKDYSFATTGHSLGGDLALVSALYVAGEKSTSDVSTRLDIQFAVKKTELLADEV